jgi:hypothetical protein
VSNANSDEKFVSDAGQSKGDVLRARDTIPTLKNMAHQEPDLQETGQKEPHLPAEPQTSPEKETGDDNVPEAQSERVKPAEGIPAAPATAEQQKSEIPRFDLAEEIMAEQRRITAIRRKAPGQIDETQKQKLEAESAGFTTEQPSPALSEQEEIIAEIVARDIEGLCRGGFSSFRSL